MRHEPRVNVAGHPRGVIGQGHRGTTHNEHIRYNTPAGKPLAEGRKGPFEVSPAEKDIARIAHAASRSRPDR